MLFCVLLIAPIKSASATPEMRVVLGSSSPFRLRLLREHLGPHTAIQVIKPDIDERAITAGAQGDLIFG